jgi:hypothetical protein
MWPASVTGKTELRQKKQKKSKTKQTKAKQNKLMGK